MDRIAHPRRYARRKSVSVQQSEFSHMRIRHLLGAGIGALAFAVAATPAAAQDNYGANEFDGFYVGGSVGYTMRDSKSGEVVEFDTNLDGNFNDTVRTTAGADAFSFGFCNGAAAGSTRAAGCDRDRDDIEYYARAGFDKQFGRLVVGVVGEFGKTEMTDSITAFSTTPANYVFTRELDWNAALRARAGLAADRTLFYATGGGAYGKIDRSFSSTNTANSFTFQDDSDHVWGWQAGGGIEQKLGNNFSVGLEYLYSRYDDDDRTIRVGPGTAPATNPFLLVNANGTDFRRGDNRFDFHSVRATAAFRF